MSLVASNALLRDAPGAHSLRNGDDAHPSAQCAQRVFSTASTGFASQLPSFDKRTKISVRVAQSTECSHKRYMRNDLAAAAATVSFDIAIDDSVAREHTKSTTGTGVGVVGHEPGGLGYFDGVKRAASRRAHCDNDAARVSSFDIHAHAVCAEIEFPDYDIEYNVRVAREAQPKRTHSMPVRRTLRCAASAVCSDDLHRERAQHIVAKPFHSRFETLRNVPAQFFKLAAREWPAHKRRATKRRRENDGRDVLDDACFHSTSHTGYGANGLLVRHYAKVDSDRVLHNDCDYDDERDMSAAELHARWEHHMCAVRGCPRTYSTKLTRGFCEAHYQQHRRRLAPVRAKISTDRCTTFFARAQLLHADRRAEHTSESFAVSLR